LIDLLIDHAFVLTMVGPGAGVVEDGCVAVEDGTIVAVGKSRKLPPAYRRARRKIDASGKAVMPGLIDGHVHTHLGLFRGEAQDIPESEWMIKAVEPFEKHLTEDSAVKSARLIVIEGLKAGTTLFNDYGPFVHSAAAQVYTKLGVRANLASSVKEVGLLNAPDEKGLYRFDADVGKKTLDENLRLIDKWHGEANERITCSLGPVAADMLSDQLLLRVKEIAAEKNLLMHFHLAQGARESVQIRTRYGMSTVEFLDKIGFLCSRLMGVHCHGASDEELRLIAKRGVRMISCPSAIALIDGIVSPVWQFLDAGGYSAALGSDQACGNNSCNMFTEMRMAAFLNKVRSRDPTVLPAWRVLRLVTIDAAKTLGLEKKIGSIEKGKQADLIIINLKRPQMTPILSTPIRNVVPNLVYSARGSEVDTVIVDGRIIMKNRKILTIREEKAIEEAQRAAERIASKAAQDYYEAAPLLVRNAKEGLL
jgi:5-methylthioadenosine/S-adenosylhomocysteine deaminase